MLLAGTLGVVACNETPVTLPMATSVVVSTSALSLPVAGGQTVSGQVLDSNGDEIESRTFRQQAEADSGE